MRVTEVKPDGKLNLSVREKAFIQMDKDALLVLARLEEKGGVLPFNDKADAEVIRAEFDLSKNASAVQSDICIRSVRSRS